MRYDNKMMQAGVIVPQIDNGTAMPSVTLAHVNAAGNVYAGNALGSITQPAVKQQPNDHRPSTNQRR